MQYERLFSIFSINVMQRSQFLLLVVPFLLMVLLLYKFTEYIRLYLEHFLFMSFFRFL